VGVANNAQLAGSVAMPIKREIIIVGAGAGGLCTGAKLKFRGLTDFLILERSSGVGGVWRQNIYPGARCDVPSHFYSFSFELKRDWSAEYAPQNEILEYFEYCQRKFELSRHILPNTNIVSATWNASTAAWTILDQSGRAYECRILILATGLFTEPNIPSLKGLDRFRGPIIHSARWDKEFDPKGKNIAVVGVGASAIQFVPEIARSAKSVLIFQREPAWIIPKNEDPYSKTAIRVFKYIPFAARLYRLKAWFDKEVGTIIRPGGWRHRNRQSAAARHLGNVTKSDEVRSKLTPSYPVGCKRLLRSSNFYLACNRANVDVVSGGIAEVLDDAVCTESGDRHAVDAILLGTGFRTTEYLVGLDVTGRKGANLHADEWKEGAHAYLGLAVADFPNMFMLYGPNTNVQTSVIHMLEHQADFIVRMVKELKRTGARSVEARRDVMMGFNDRLQKAMVGSVWLSGCGNYFTNKFGKVSTQWPFRATRYWLSTRRLRPNRWIWDVEPSIKAENEGVLSGSKGFQ
jgi:cyclohexanone monooxygenase